MTGAGGSSSSIYDLGYQGYDGPRLGRPAVALGLLGQTLRAAYGIGRGGRAKIMPFLMLGLSVLPAILAVLGQRINKVRVMPRRFLDHGHAEDGAWGRWARFVLRRPVAVASVGIVIVLALAEVTERRKAAWRRAILALFAFGGIGKPGVVARP